MKSIPTFFPLIKNIKVYSLIVTLHINNSSPHKFCKEITCNQILRDCSLCHIFEYPLLPTQLTQIP